MAGVDVPIRPIPRRDAGAAGPAVQHGGQPAAPFGRRRHRRPAARRCPIVGHELVGGRGPGRARRARGPRAPDGRGGPKLDPRGPRRAVPRRVVGRAPAGRLEGRGRHGRELSRTFKTIDHAVDDGVEGFVTITGGKATTLRGMAEVCADVVCRKLGIDAPCRTRDTVLLPHTAHLRGMRRATTTTDPRCGCSGSSRATSTRFDEFDVPVGDRAPRCWKRCGGSSCTWTARSRCATRASTPRAARAACE